MSACAHQSQGKLEPMSVNCVFIVYLIGVKGYRLWVRESLYFKVIMSRDVIFDEYIMPCKYVKSADTNDNSSEFSQFELFYESESHDLGYLSDLEAIPRPLKISSF